MTDEPTLLSRVLAATGPDRELDGAIDGLVGHEGEAWPARYTAVALVGQIGGNRYVSLHDIGGAHWRAEIAARPPYVAEHRMPALALLAALLRSLGQ